MLSGEKIKFIRQIHGKTQAEIAKLAGVSKPYISGIESGRERPSEEKFQTIMKAIYSKSTSKQIDKTSNSDVKIDTSENEATE